MLQAVIPLLKDMQMAIIRSAEGITRQRRPGPHVSLGNQEVRAINVLPGTPITNFPKSEPRTLPSDGGASR